jgi:CheY-like chemotaxis protein
MNIETRRSKILIVDDTPANVTLLTDLLESNGFLTIQATSGPAALDQLNRDTPDLVLLDVRMPDMSGYEVCKRIREQPDTALLRSL